MKAAGGYGKANQPVAGIRAGTLCIWDAGVSGNDYSPVISPKAHLSRIGLHSDLDYIGVASVLTGAAARGAGDYTAPGINTSVVLGAHGQAGKPLILAEFSLDGVNWLTVNGTTYTHIGQTLRGRSFHIQCDASTVYAYINEVGAVPAQTIYFRVHVLARTFGGTRVYNDYAFRAQGNLQAYVEAGYGAFDTRRKYLQTPGPGQAADIFHRTGPTLKSVASQPGQINLGISTSAYYANVPLGDLWSTSWPPYLTTVTPTQLVFAGPGSYSSVLRFGAGNFTLSNAQGEDIFNSSRKLVAFVDEFKTSINIPSRPLVSGDTPHEIVHYSQPVAAGTNLIMGWLQLTSSSLNIINGRPIDFSSAVIITGGWFVPSGTSILLLHKLSILYPRLINGFLQVVENYYCYAGGAGTPTTPLPSYSVDVHLFACATTGGL